MIDALPPLWDPARDGELVCVAVRPETHDVATFVFTAHKPRLFQFQPGQFMTFELPAAGIQRCYTIASPPTRPHRIEITTKRAGPGSAWLHDTMRPGMRVAATGPHGDFTHMPGPAGRCLFLSAGSGITPLMSWPAPPMIWAPAPTSCSCTARAARPTWSSPTNSPP